MNNRKKEYLEMLKGGHPLTLYNKYNINLDVNNRWESGIPHHPKSEDLMDHMMVLDMAYMDDHHCFKTGGDGDNGEILMYLFDLYFELQDKLNAEKQHEMAR
jgi:hypothetical protein